MDRSQIDIYWAGPLFRLADRLMSKECKSYLEKKGYQVELPQERAERYFDPEKGLDMNAVRLDCEQQCRERKICIFLLEGADPDSGTSVEFGIRREVCRIDPEKKTIGVRTDFRATGDNGNLNLMFCSVDCLIDLPSYRCKSIDQLCDLIDEAIMSLY